MALIGMPPSPTCGLGQVMTAENTINNIQSEG